MMDAEGGCYCGAVRYRVTADPVVKVLCFCRVCQRVSGGSPAVIMGVPGSGFSYSAGTPSSFSHPDVEGPTERDFCPSCGVQLASRTPGAPGITMVKAGTLDDPALFGSPQFAIFAAQKQPFHAIPEGVPVFDAAPVR